MSKDQAYVQELNEKGPRYAWDAWQQEAKALKAQADAKIEAEVRSRDEVMRRRSDPLAKLTQKQEFQKLARQAYPEWSDEQRSSTVLLGARRKQAESGAPAQTKREQGQDFIRQRVAEADQRRAEIAANQQQGRPYTGHTIVSPSGDHISEAKPEPVGKGA